MNWEIGLHRGSRDSAHPLVSGPKKQPKLSSLPRIHDTWSLESGLRIVWDSCRSLKNF